MHGADFTVGPDYLEVGSFIGLAVVTRSALRIADCRPDQHGMTRIMLNRLGVDWRVDGNDIVVPEDQVLTVVDDHGHAVPKIDDAPWPGVPADLISIATVIATQARGIWSRSSARPPLLRRSFCRAMGARIILTTRTAPSVIASPLYGQRSAPDNQQQWRCSSPHCAEGESVIDNVQDRPRLQASRAHRWDWAPTPPRWHNWVPGKLAGCRKLPL